jgi:hypothetical protein
MIPNIFAVFLVFLAFRFKTKSAAKAQFLQCFYRMYEIDGKIQNCKSEIQNTAFMQTLSATPFLCLYRRNG